MGNPYVAITWLVNELHRVQHEIYLQTGIMDPYFNLDQGMLLGTSLTIPLSIAYPEYVMTFDFGDRPATILRTRFFLPGVRMRWMDGSQPMTKGKFRGKSRGRSARSKSAASEDSEGTTKEVGKDDSPDPDRS